MCREGGIRKIDVEKNLMCSVLIEEGHTYSYLAGSVVVEIQYHLQIRERFCCLVEGGFLVATELSFFFFFQKDHGR